MEELIKSYGLDYKLFQVTLSAANGIIAGSSVLCEFLKVSKEKSSKIKDFKPNDLDIWISGEIEHRIGMILQTYLESLGYTRKILGPINDIPRAEHHYDTPGIVQVLEFKKEDKIIQIIYIDHIPVRKFISDFFDLSCCMVYWDSINEKIKHLYPEATLKGRMKAIRKEDNFKVKQRIQKYESRGFKLCNKLIEEVTFEEDSIYNDIVCHDIVGFEDYKIPEFIEKSEDGIVIKCGEAYYGYEREYFLDYLRTHLDFTEVKNKLFYDNQINSMISPQQIKFSFQVYNIINAETAVIYQHNIINSTKSCIDILKEKNPDRTKTVDNLKLGLNKDIKKFSSESVQIESKFLEERLKHFKTLELKPKVLPVQVVNIQQAHPIALPQLPPLPNLDIDQIELPL